MTTVVERPPLWSHQAGAIEFCIEKRASYIDAWMGVGKSRIAVELFREWRVKAAVILSPLRVIPAWEKQFHLFGQGDERIIAPQKGTSVKRAQAVKRTLEGGGRVVVLLNYDIIRSEAFERLLTSRVWDALVFDEAHRLKSPGGKTSRIAARIPATHRVALSGTMMPHSPLDVYGQFRALDKRLFGTSFVRFRSKYAIMGGYEGHEVVDYQNLDEMRERLASLTYSIPKDVLDLPTSSHEVIDVELSPKARRAYQAMEDFLRVELDRGEVVAANGLVKLLRLQQITGGYIPVEDDTGEAELERVDTSKEVALASFFEDLPEKEPVVVFARFRGDLDAIHAAASKAERWSVELSGRRNDLDEWQRGDLKMGGVAPTILAVQIQAGGVGIDLTRAAYCVFYSTGFSLGEYLQARERLHRPGQERHVFYYHLVAKGTVDVRVNRAIENRKNLIEETLRELRERTPTE